MVLNNFAYDGWKMSTSRVNLDLNHILVAGGYFSFFPKGNENLKWNWLFREVWDEKGKPRKDMKMSTRVTEKILGFIEGWQEFWKIPFSKNLKKRWIMKFIYTKIVSKKFNFLKFICFLEKFSKKIL